MVSRETLFNILSLLVYSESKYIEAINPVSIDGMNETKLHKTNATNDMLNVENPICVSAEPSTGSGLGSK